MSKNEKSEPNDLSLWRRYRGGDQGLSGSQAAAEQPDSLTLAAYLDGTLSEAEREQVETRLARAPDDLELVLAARGALDENSGPAPDSFVARACGLVPEATGLGTNSLSRLVKAIAGTMGAGSLFWQPVAWSGAAAAVLLACTIGFQLGQSGYAGVLSMERVEAREAGMVLGPSAEDFL